SSQQRAGRCWTWSRAPRAESAHVLESVRGGLRCCAERLAVLIDRTERIFDPLQQLEQGGATRGAQLRPLAALLAQLLGEGERNQQQRLRVDLLSRRQARQ